MVPRGATRPPRKRRSQAVLRGAVCVLGASVAAIAATDPALASYAPGCYFTTSCGAAQLSAYQAPGYYAADPYTHGSATHGPFMNNLYNGTPKAMDIYISGAKVGRVTAPPTNGVYPQYWTNTSFDSSLINGGGRFVCININGGIIRVTCGHHHH